MTRATAAGRSQSHAAISLLNAAAKRPWVAVLLFAAVVASIYGPFVASPFYFDDSHSVSKNPSIRSLSNIPDFFTDPSAFSLHGKGRLYRPILLTSYAASYAITGPEPWSFRIVNLLLHALNGLLVFFLIRRLLANGEGEFPALAGALLFTTHPAQTQALMYISSRSEILAASFLLLALLFFLHAYHDLQQHDAVSLGHWIAALLAFGLALLTKASGSLFLPAAFLVGLATTVPLDLRGLRKLLFSLTPFLGLYVAHAWLKMTLHAPVPGWPTEVATAAGSPTDASDLLLRIQAFGVYVRLAVVPYPLSIFHELPEEGLPRWAGVTLSVALLLALVVGSVLAFRKRQVLLALGLSWFPAMLVVYFLVFLHLTVNEHRLYLALFGLAVITADVVRRANRRYSTAVLTVVLTLYVVGTVARNRQWADEETFWLHEVRAAPGHAWPYENLALFYESTGRTEDAVQTFVKARIRPHAHLGLIHNYFGTLDVEGHRFAQAHDQFIQALAHDPDSPEYLSNLGSVLDDLGQLDAAREYLERALSVAPCFAKAHFNLALLYANTNRIADAETSARSAVECDNYNGTAHALLGWILLSRRENAAALRHLEHAATVIRNDCDVLYELARARVRSGMPDRALAALERASALRCNHLQNANTEPDFKTLRDVTRFRQLTIGARNPGP